MIVTLKHAINGCILGSFEASENATIIECKKYLRLYNNIRHNYRFLYQSRELKLIDNIQEEISVVYTEETTSYMRIAYFEGVNSIVNIYELLTGTIFCTYTILNDCTIVGYLYEQIFVYSRDRNLIMLYDVYNHSYNLIVSTEYEPLSFVLSKNNIIILNEVNRVTMRNSLTLEIIKIISLSTVDPLYCIGLTSDENHIILKSDKKILLCYNFDNNTIKYINEKYASNRTVCFPLLTKYLFEYTRRTRMTKIVDSTTLENVMEVSGYISNYCEANSLNILVLDISNVINIWYNGEIVNTIENISERGMFFSSDDKYFILFNMDDYMKIYLVEELLNGLLTVTPYFIK